MTEENQELTPRKIQKADLKKQVEEELLLFIKKFDLSKNVKLPREEELAKMMGVSRITLRSVLDELAVKGMIFRKHGKGTFINSSFFEMKASFNPVMNFIDTIRNSGYEPSVEMIQCKLEEAGHEVARHLCIDNQDEVLVCDKVFYADKQMCAITRDYIPAGYLGEDGTGNLANYKNSIFNFIHEINGKKLEWDKVELNAVYSKDVKLVDELLVKFQIEPKAFLLLKGVIYDEDNIPAVYSWEYIDTTILKFSQIRKRILKYEQSSGKN